MAELKAKWKNYIKSANTQIHSRNYKKLNLPKSLCSLSSVSVNATIWLRPFELEAYKIILNTKPGRRPLTTNSGTSLLMFFNKVLVVSSRTSMTKLCLLPPSKPLLHRIWKDSKVLLITVQLVTGSGLPLNNKTRRKDTRVVVMVTKAIRLKLNRWGLEFDKSKIRYWTTHQLGIFWKCTVLWSRPTHCGPNRTACRSRIHFSVRIRQSYGCHCCSASTATPRCSMCCWSATRIAYHRPGSQLLRTWRAHFLHGQLHALLHASCNTLVRLIKETRKVKKPEEYVKYLMETYSTFLKTSVQGTLWFNEAGTEMYLKRLQK